MTDPRNPNRINDLEDRHTRLFRDQALDGSYSHVSPGWFDLADKLCCDLEALHASEMLRIVQVKEKFGRMRVYVSPRTTGTSRALMAQAQALCDAAEKQSESICQGCGARSTLHQDAMRWWNTLCPSCTSKKESAG